VVVAAAGNSGASIREYPAADNASGLLAVAASTEADALAAFSTYGSWVRVAAPGDRVLSSIPGGKYATWSGTSMAAPIVAGVTALTRAAYPGLRPTDTVTRVATTAAQIKADVRKRVDAAEAVGWVSSK
jgi:subtilisin family serine protease